MSELLIDILGAWVRSALLAASGYLVAHHAITASQGDRLTSELFTHIMLAAPAVIGVGWSMWSKYTSRLKFLTALEMPAGTSEARVNDAVSTGTGARLNDAVPALVLAAGLATGALVAASFAGCASLPVKQKALVGLQSVETALGSAQDFERANYVALGENVPASPSLRTFCPSSALPAPLPETATIHQVVSCLFVQAFASQQASATALQTWSPGSVPPSFMADLRGEVDTLFGIIKGLSQNVHQQQMLSLAQSTVDSVLTVVQVLGGHVASMTPGDAQ